VSPLAARASAYVFPIRIGGITRDYRLHVPPAAASGRALPLVLNLHGSTQNATLQELQSGMDASSDRDGYLVAYPNGTRVATKLTPDPVAKDAQYSWNAGVCCGLPVDKHIDDVAFLEAVIDDVEHHTLVDRRRVYMTGMSSGGMMAYAMAAQASDRVAAIASVSGQVEMPAIHPSRPVPTMEFHSVDDPVAKFSGVANTHPSQRFSVMDGIDQWVQADGCARAPHTAATIRGAAGSSSAGETATLVTYSPCRSGSAVELWRFTGSGHVWPGAPFNTGPPSTWILDGVGRGITLVDANERMWQFFQHYELPSR
jgi:polyhydroxybutyrate depolymerase